jgi:hypothetical protein
MRTESATADRRQQMIETILDDATEQLAPLYDLGRTVFDYCGVDGAEKAISESRARMKRELELEPVYRLVGMYRTAKQRMRPRAAVGGR